MITESTLYGSVIKLCNIDNYCSNLCPCMSVMGVMALNKNIRQGYTYIVCYFFLKEYRASFEYLGWLYKILPF